MKVVGCALAFVAISFLCIIAAVMRKSKHLMQHPNQLTFYMCYAEAMACFHCVIEIMGTKFFICFWDLDELLKKSWFLPISNCHAIEILRKSNVVLF